MSLDGSNNGISRAAQRTLDAADEQQTVTRPIPKRNEREFSRREERGGLSRREASRRDGDQLSQVTDLLSGKDFRGVTRDEDDHARGKGVDRPARSGKDAPADASRSDLEDLDDELEPYQRPRKGQRTTIAKFAEERGIDPKELYNLYLPFEDDDEQPMTVQQLRDDMGKVKAHQHERDEFEIYKTDSLNEVYSARQQIDGLLAEVKNLVTPEQFASAFHVAQETWKQNQVKAAAELRELFPEWADERTKRAEITELYEFGKKWRFSKQELDSLNDARTIYFMTKMMRREKILERMRSEREKRPTETATSKRQYRPDLKQQARELAKKGDQLGAVTKLIGG
jgi:hypothetical protein